MLMPPATNGLTLRRTRQSGEHKSVQPLLPAEPGRVSAPVLSARREEHADRHFCVMCTA
jgi:hypothetical protein